MGIVIPTRFRNVVDEHIVGNILELENYPVILSIFGTPGIGKTFQLRTILKEREFLIHSINAADLESDRAGEPTKLLRKEYVNASAEIVNGKGAAIVIDDIDTTLGEWEKFTGTVNHQDLIAFFMHIADSPTSIENVSTNLKRVPIFFTGNDLSKLYHPLRRPGRMNVFEYNPTLEEKIDVLDAMIGMGQKEEIRKMIEKHPDRPISYYASIKASLQAVKYSKFVESIDFKQMINDIEYKQMLRSRYIQLQEENIIDSILKEIGKDDQEVY